MVYKSTFSWISNINSIASLIITSSSSKVSSCDSALA
jgi:hypothetical protein